MIRETRVDKPRDLFELLALQLELHGPTAVTLPVTRRLARSSLWMELRILLRTHGFTEAEIAHLMNIHPPGCPCWKCVKGLNRWVREIRKKAATRRRRLV